MSEPVPFGQTPDGRQVHLCRLESGGLTAEVLTFGATLNRLVWHTGRRPLDTVLGFPSLEARLRHPNIFLGGVVGPFANRIGGSRMTIDGVEHTLTANDGPNCLHGGDAGIDRRIWDVVALRGDSVTLRHVSPDGDGGFPGPITATATYTVTRNRLDLELTAVSERPTVVSLASHAYLNLAGGGSIDGHTLRVPAEELVAVDAAGIPEARSSVVDAGLHLRRPTDLADVRRRDVPLVRLLGGVDLPFLPDGSGRRVVAELSLPSTGRSLELWSDQPCLQVYTGNALTSTAPGHDGRLYRPGDGIALEPQWVPDAPNQSWTPTPILRPGSRYHSHTSWSFTQA